MTSPGRHAASDGSFSKSAGSALFRGGGLVALAVLIGLVLLYWVYDDDNGALTVGTGDTGQVADTDGDAGNGEEANAGVSDGTQDEPADGTDTTTPTPTSEPAATDPEPDDSGNRQPPEETTALAVNGVGTKGLAGKLQSELNTLNYKTEAANLSGNTDASIIYFKPNYKGNARDVADALGWPPSVIKKFPNDGSVVLSNDNARVDAANIILVIGADGIFQ